MTKRRGRPPFRPTPANRRTIERMLACGDSHNTIARALDIDVDTMRKHFPEELLNGAAKRRRQVVDMVFNGAQKGNASLIKRVEEMTRVAIANEKFGGQEEPPEDHRATSQGKKKQQQEAAERIGGKFAVPAAPKLVVNNQ